MDENAAIAALTALAQPTRLRIFRHLVRLHPDAVPAGEAARLCETPHNTMSTHLAILTRAGLISVAREGRSMLYRAELDGFRALVAFLAHDCCGGRPEICAPVLAAAVPDPDCSCEAEATHG